MTCEHRADESYYEDELHLCALRPRKKDSRPEVHPWCVCDSWKLTTNADVLEWIAEAGKDGVSVADKPTLRDMVNDGASVRRIVDYIREQLKEGGRECNVVIEYSITRSWTAVVELDTGAVLRVGCGQVHGAEPIDTLVELVDRIEAAVKRYWELNPKETTD